MIHCYKLGGMNIVLDVCSGSVHVVDEVAYDIIAMYETSTREAIVAAMLENIPIGRMSMLQRSSSAATSWSS